MFIELLQSKTFVNVLFILTAFFIIQIFFMRPRKKEEDARENFLKLLKLGTKVVTIGGVHGKVVKINDTTVVLEVDSRGFTFVVNKQAIASPSKNS